MNWISVEEGLPGNEERVLVAWSDYVEIGYLTIPPDKRYLPYWTDSGDEQTCTTKINEGVVTHWMPLPEPPNHPQP